jgi:hypothetical protein
MSYQAPLENIERILLTEQERKRKLADYVRNSCAKGWIIESQNDFNAVLFSGQRCNHTMHALIALVGGIFTCGFLFLWIIPWIILTFTQYQQRMILSIDEWGDITTQIVRM